MKNIKKILALLMITVILVFGGCTSSMTKGGNLTDFAYCIGEDEYPRIYLVDDGTFIITYDVMDRTLIEGTYSMPDKETAKLVTLDGSEYFFTVDKKNRCLIFDGEKSDVFAEEFNEIYEIKDGTVFNVWE